MTTKTAELIAEQLNNDGMCFEDAQGRSLDCICSDAGARREARGTDSRYQFADGSAIIIGRRLWDIRHPRCTCGWCWEGGHATSVPPCVEEQQEAAQDRADVAEEIYDAAGEDGMISAADSVAIAGPTRPDAHGQTDMRGLARKLGCLAELEALIADRA